MVELEQIPVQRCWAKDGEGVMERLKKRSRMKWKGVTGEKKAGVEIEPGEEEKLGRRVE